MIKTLFSVTAVVALVGVGAFASGGTVIPPAGTEVASFEIARPARGAVLTETTEVAEVVRPHLARGVEGPLMTAAPAVRNWVPRGGR